MSEGGTTDPMASEAPHRSTGLRFTGVIPAAGASRRMGRAKALLPYAGETFLARVVHALSEGGCERVIVMVGPDAEPIHEAAVETGADVFVNPTPGDGPITSMRRALAEVDEAADGIAWLPLDFPLVTADHVQQLLGEATRTSAPLTIPVCDGKRGHPALFRARLFPELADEGLEGGARTVVHRHLDDACLVPFDDPAVVTDVDTPDAYSALTSA